MITFAAEMPDRPAFPRPHRRSFLIAAALAVCARPAFAQANEEGARQFIDSLGRSTLAIQAQNAVPIQQREAQMRELLRQGFDLDFIGRFVLGRAYNGLTPDAAADYQQAFSEFVLKTYARRIAGFQARGFAITGSRIAGDTDTVITTRIDPANGNPVSCEWRVRSGPTRQAIIDVAVEGVSMAVTQRNEFAATVNNSGVAGLVSVLRARTDRETISAAR